MSKIIADKIQLSSDKQSYQEGRLGIVLVLLIVALIGLFSNIYDSSKDQLSTLKILIYLIPSNTYIIGLFFYNRLENKILLQGSLLAIYIIHSTIEFACGYYPDEILKPASLSATGHLTRGGAIVDLIPTIYFAFRLAFTVVFIRLLLIARRISRK